MGVINSIMRNPPSHKCQTLLIFRYAAEYVTRTELLNANNCHVLLLYVDGMLGNAVTFSVVLSPRCTEPSGLL